MKIRTKLTLLFTFITATILLTFAAVIYITAKESREKEFYTILKKEAITKANLFLNARVDKNTLQDIYLNNRQILDEVEVAIYDTNFNLVYHDAVEIDFVKETSQMLKQIQHGGHISFYQNDWQVLGLRYTFQGEDFIVTAAAFDQYGYNKLNNLFHTIIVVFLISILFIYAAGRYFSRKAFEPISAMTHKAMDISATKLDLRLPNNHNKDELSALAQTFNEMLDRLEKSFDAQKHFVSNISHELRTPLAAIITELELSIGKDRTVAEYKEAINNALNDAKKIVRLSNSLLDLAKASYDPSEIAFKPTRIDEVLLDARQQVQKANRHYKIDIHFEYDFDNDNQISVNGNEYLLKVAFINLFENGCKFSSDQRSIVSIAFEAGKIKLAFTDDGIGIPAMDKENIFSPFYRGQNKQYADGNGIGLSLTKKIITLHEGTIALATKEQKGTTFYLVLPVLG